MSPVIDFPKAGRGSPEAAACDVAEKIARAMFALPANRHRSVGLSASIAAALIEWLMACGYSSEVAIHAGNLAALRFDKQADEYLTP